MNAIELIVACAKVPSYSTYEERLHPLIHEICAQVDEATIYPVADNNLVIKVAGDESRPPVALTAHLDKIDHFEGEERELAVRLENGRIIGQMDNTAGLGVCLDLMFRSRSHDFPTLYLLFSEMEEGTGLRQHPERMKNAGVGYKAGMGAERIAHFLLDELPLPACVITIDTTPKFKGEPGIALYDTFWHRTDGTFEASALLKNRIDGLKSFFQRLHPEILFGNAVNDYIEYGIVLNKAKPAAAIPSIAIEPSIFPYHQENEGVYCEDVEKIVDMLTAFLASFDFQAF